MGIINIPASCTRLYQGKGKIHFDSNKDKAYSLISMEFRIIFK
jgi:hypothetical protein